MTTLDRDVCYRAIQTRDARFDGRLFTAVLTTGIYCRPICPARCPKLQNVVFYATAAAAQEAGFRPCLRCRPESSPDLAVWRGTSNTVARALSLIADGALDGDGCDVDGLALRLGIGERQLRRLFQKHLGASPIAVAQTRRVHFAKQLIHETHMRMVDVAMASGFGSLRRFNDTFRALYGRPPSALRGEPRHQRGAGIVDVGNHPKVQKTREVSGKSGHCGEESLRAGGITLLLSYAPPYDWTGMIEFLAARAISGVEVVEPDRYRRTIEIDGQHGTIDIAPSPKRHALVATIRFPDVAALSTIVARIRRVFDLGADVAAIAAQLAEDPHLAPLVAARPGLRVPGAWDGFELGIRAVLGQQITVRAARLLAAKLVGRYGEPFDPTASGAASGLTTVFPRPERLVGVNLATLGMPRARAATLSGLAAGAADDATLFRSDGNLDQALARLRALPGIGEWTAQYIALRALREPDAFPASDVGLLRAMAAVDGTRPTPIALLRRAETWRPWRAYAAQYLWTSGPVATRVAQEAVA